MVNQDGDIEAKRQERLNLSEAMRQAARDAQETGERPMVIHRRNRQEWLVTFKLRDIHELAEALNG